jgi:CRP-like cAMP-binding protein
MISPEILHRYPFFAAVPDEGLRVLAGMCEELAVPAGTVLYREDDKADKLYILVEGEIDIQYTLGSGELRTVDTIVPGELLMWSALVEPFRSTAVVTARQDCRLIAVDAERIRSYCDQDPDVTHNMLLHLTQLLSTRLEGARIQLATLA